jgi:uncharacterized protein (DUF952 family)
MGEKVIFHICRSQDWEEAQKLGEYRAGSLSTEGFIHCSEMHQVAGVAKTFYKDVPDLVLLYIEVEKLIPELIYEEADGQEFPHIYGPINLNAVLDAPKMEKNSVGVFEGPII